jgi:hypothetical protein
MHSPAPGRHSHGHADLRMALRHIPILPAPKTIEDLVARLDETASIGSAALEQIVHDARSDSRAGSQESRQGHREFLRLAQSCWRTATNKVQLGSRWPRVINASVLFGAAVLIPTTSDRGDRALLVTRPAHVSEKIVSSSTPRDLGHSGEVPRSLSTREVDPDPLSRERYVSRDTSNTAPRNPPKKFQTSRPRKPRARQTTDRRYASFPVGLVCRVAKILLLKCTVRA